MTNTGSDKLVASGLSEWVVGVRCDLGENLHDRIHSQRLVVVAIFVTQGDAANPLGQHGFHFVSGFGRIAGIGNATGEGIDQACATIGFPQQQGSAVGREPAAVEISENFLRERLEKVSVLWLHSVIERPLCHVE